MLRIPACFEDSRSRAEERAPQALGAHHAPTSNHARIPLTARLVLAFAPSARDSSTTEDEHSAESAGGSAKSALANVGETAGDAARA